MIRIDHDEGIATLTWDMPGRAQNVFNESSLSALGGAIAELAADEAVTGIVLTSGKRDFAAGADLEDLELIAFGNLPVEELNSRIGALSQMLRKLETCGKPVVAAVNGTAMGGGFELALACHHRVVADNPRIQLGLPEATLGLLPGAGGTQRLPRLIGIQASLPLLMEGKRIRPKDAVAAGIFHQAVPAEQLIDAAKAWLRGSPTAAQPWDAKRGFRAPGGNSDDPRAGNLFMAGTAMYQAKTHGRYPAGTAIMSCVWEGCRVAMDPALEIEKRYFISLITNPVAGAMIRTMFLSMQEANKLVSRPKGVDKKRPKRIGVLGAGLMGSGITYSAAKAGIQVLVLDTTAEKAAGALQYVASKMDRSISKGFKTEADKEALLAHIHPTTEFADLAGCDAIIEAVFEDREVKANVTRQADAVLDDDAVFGSNTSTLPITGLAAASSRPERFIGLHFFSPVEKMPLVEVIRGEATSDETLAWSLDLVQALGKTPIVVRDSRGFYTSRVFGTYITEGMVMLKEGVKPALIENAGKASGMPMPPLALADEVGLALMYQVGKQTAADLGDALPPNPSTPVLELVVAEHDRGGRRAGAGFYTYEGRSKRLWSEIGTHFAAKADQPSVDELVERFLYAQAIETARCMNEGLMLSHRDADVGAILGWGFAPWTGGPLSYIDGIGIAAFVARADELAAAYGERFRPPPLLRQMAEEGRGFYS